MKFKLSRQNSPSCYFFDYEGKNKNEETLCVELVKCTNSHKKNGLPTLWKKNGWTDTELETWWSVNTYVTNKDGNCWSRYNPQHIDYQRFVDGKRVESRYIINFKWMFEATQENAERLFKECERMFLECAPTETKIINE